MCVAVPARIVELSEPNRATVDMDGVRFSADLSLVDGVRVGDYVLLHAGFAIQKLDQQEAQATLALFQELAALAQKAQTGGVGS